MASVIIAGNGVGSIPGDFCNLLQVAASALHLLDLKLDDDLRPLARAGLAAISQAATASQSFFPTATLQLTRSI